MQNQHAHFSGNQKTEATGLTYVYLVVGISWMLAVLMFLPRMAVG